jgi:hypothetical protein
MKISKMLPVKRTDWGASSDKEGIRSGFEDDFE